MSTAALPFSVRGETLSVAGIEHGACTACDEVYLSLDSAERLQKEAIRQSKAARGLLAPDEIRNLRHSLSLSQAAFERMLGVGAKTVVRWEKGTVFQSATADRLMRLVRAMPELADMLSSRALAEGTVAHEDVAEYLAPGSPAMKPPVFDRRALMTLSIDERRTLLKELAASIEAHYKTPADDWQAGDFDDG